MVRPKGAEGTDIPPLLVSVPEEEAFRYDDASLYVTVSRDPGVSRFQWDRIFNRIPWQPPVEQLPWQYVSTGGLAANDVGAMWDEIQLTDTENDVIDATRLILPEIERVGVRGKPSGQRTSVPIVRVKGRDEPIPLRVYGDVLNRLFGLSLSLVNAKDGLLLVDEIENGLHYSVFVDVWRVIFKLAAKFNVQIFATTHSSDCIRGFQRAAKESSKDGQLVRLKVRGGLITATSLTIDQLDLASQSRIEVRG